ARRQPEAAHRPAERRGRADEIGVDGHGTADVLSKRRALGPSAMPRSRILDEIRRLDPQRDDQRIVYLSTCFEFPFDTTRALAFALFRSFASPSVSALLDRTGEFAAR